MNNENVLRSTAWVLPLILTGGFGFYSTNIWTVKENEPKYNVVCSLETLCQWLELNKPGDNLWQVAFTLDCHHGSLSSTHFRREDWLSVQSIHQRQVESNFPILNDLNYFCSRYRWPRNVLDDCGAGWPDWPKAVAVQSVLLYEKIQVPRGQTCWKNAC